MQSTQSRIDSLGATPSQMVQHKDHYKQEPILVFKKTMNSESNSGTENLLQRYRS